jgi:biopolymer transport protein ExbD/biopolymer transport protein TolR
MQKPGGHKKTMFTSINITPLTDIFLVLLVIMMVVAPFMHQMRSDVKLPDVVSGSEAQKDVVSVDVTSDGKYFIDDIEVPLERLVDILRQKGERFVEKKLVVQADKDAKSKSVLAVFRAAEDAQFAMVTVLGQSSSSAKAQEDPDKEKVNETVTP